jgi:anti-anti-sigma factor
MKFSLDKREKLTILSLEEDKIESISAPKLKSELVKLSAEGFPNLVLDLSAVKYIDSSGLSALLVGHRICKEQQGLFVITGINDHVLKLIKISQLDSVFELLPSNEEAIDAIFMHEIEKQLNQSEEGNL